MKKSVVEKMIADAQAKAAKSKAFGSEEKQKASDKEKSEQIASFFKALATQDKGALAEVNEQVAAELKEQNVGTDGDGGYLVPTTLDQSIREKLHAISSLRPVFNVISNMPAKLDLTTENALPTVYWTAEGAAITESKATVGQSQLVPHKLAGLDSFTSEVLADAATNPGIMSYVESRFAIALAKAEAAAFVGGNGTTQPYGFRNAVITPNSVAQASASLVADDVKAAYYTQPRQYRSASTWLMTDGARQLIDTLKDSNGRYLWQDAISEGTDGTLLGRPVVIVDEIPENLGTGTDETEIWFVYGQNYLIGDRGGMRVETGLNGSDFAEDKISMRMIKRVGGIPILQESFTKLTGVK